MTKDRNLEVNTFNNNFGNDADDDNSDDDGLDNRHAITIRRRPEFSELDTRWQMDEAMLDGVHYILIDYPQLGEETVMAIRFGNFLHKGAVLNGLFSYFGSSIGNMFGIPIVQGVLTSFSCIFALAYNFTWAPDPCCKYQVVPPERFAIDAPMFDNDGEVVGQTLLVKKDDTFRRQFHNFFAGCSISYLLWTSPLIAKLFLRGKGLLV